MSRKRKFYQASKMLRAGRTLSLVRCPVTAFQIDDAGTYRVVVTCKVTAITRDGAGFPKEFARAVAGIPPERLTLYACDAAESEAMVGQLNVRNKAATDTPHRWLAVPEGWYLGSSTGFGVNLGDLLKS